MSCDVGPRRGLDPVLLWLRRRPAATAPIGPLAWELPYAAGVALKRQKENIRAILDSQINERCQGMTSWTQSSWAIIC